MDLRRILDIIRKIKESRGPRKINYTGGLFYFKGGKTATASALGARILKSKKDMAHLEKMRKWQAAEVVSRLRRL